MRILVCPLDAVARVMAQHAPQAVVTLLAPPAEPPVLDLPPDRRLTLTFHDVSGPGHGLTPPGADDVARLLAFLSDAKDCDPVLIHCWMGVSRSTAAAYIAATLRDGPGSEAALAQRLRHAAPFATPNPRLIKLADAALARGGTMVAAIRAIRRGEEIPAAPFEL